MNTLILNYVPSLAARIDELRLCGPGHASSWRVGPATDSELEKCERFLSDLGHCIVDHGLDELSVINSLIALKAWAPFTLAKVQGRNHDSNTLRDSGMGAMIQNFISSQKQNSKFIIMAHAGHLGRRFEKLSPFSDKVLGTFLAQIYGDRYFVSAAISEKPSHATWWSIPLCQPNSGSLENILAPFGNIFLDVRQNTVFHPEAKVDFLCLSQVKISSTFDALISLPFSFPMTE